MSTQKLFTTQIYKKALKPMSQQFKNELKGLVLETELIEKADPQGRNWSKTNYRNGYTSYSSQDQIHKLSSSFEDVEKWIRKHINAYLKKLDYQATAHDLVMTDFWVNRMKKNTIHTAHIHPQSVISGTVYLSTPSNSSCIQFEDPRLGFFMNSPQIKIKARKENQRFIQVFPQAGDIVLFESWLKHEVPLNNSKEPRISVSFNYGWKMNG